MAPVHENCVSLSNNIIKSAIKLFDSQPRLPQETAGEPADSVRQVEGCTYKTIIHAPMKQIDRQMQPHRCPAVSHANSHQIQRAGRCPWKRHLFKVLLIWLLHTASTHAGRAAATDHSTTPAAASGQNYNRHGRSLKQLGYDPYGIGYYDPYQSGVTPGFVNVDLNRETGLHVDVGTVAVDISADKNYYGLGVGNLLGVGAAKDRGWNLQIGGGNIVDVSVTKDAGLGLWLLNGLANIQIGPDGRGWETGHIAAQSVPGQTAAAAATAGQQVTSVIVDEPSADAKAAEGEVHVASDAATAAATEEPIITEEAISPELTAAAAATEPPPPGAVQQAVGAARSSAARRSRPRTYVEPRPAVYVQPRSAVVAPAGDEATVWSDQQGGSGAAAAAAAAAVPSTHHAAQQPTAAAAEVVVTPAAAEVAVQAVPGFDTMGQEPAQQREQQQQQQPAAVMPTMTPAAAPVAAAAAATPKRVCEGGELVAVPGNKLRCRYKKGTRQPAAAGAAGQSSGPAALLQ